MIKKEGDIFMRTKKKDLVSVMLKEFKKTYPTMAKQIVHFYPDKACTLIIYLKDGTKLSYDYDYGRAIRLKEKWKT